MWDLGGQTSIRPYWRCYYPNTDAIIFVVDSCDSERLNIAKQELMAMLEVWTEEDFKFLVFTLYYHLREVAKNEIEIVHFSYPGGGVEGCYLTSICQQTGLERSSQRPTGASLYLNFVQSFQMCSNIPINHTLRFLMLLGYQILRTGNGPSRKLLPWKAQVSLRVLTGMWFKKTTFCMTIISFRHELNFYHLIVFDCRLVTCIKGGEA